MSKELSVTVVEEPDTRVNIAGIALQNPVMTASGTFGYGEEYDSLFDLGQLGAIVVKAITSKPRLGNPPPRVVETAAGMLSSCGLQNVGVDRFINDKMPFLKKVGIPVIVNITGESVDEFAVLGDRLSNTEGISALELNVSCPNVRQGGMVFGRDPAMVRQIVRAVKAESAIPVICKLTPNVTDIVEVAAAAADGGADAVSLINALLGLAIDVESGRPKLGNITGGLTGPAIKPVALRMVWEVARAVPVPVIGIGGITTEADALEFIMAGAAAVQVGTANFFRPKATVEIAEGIKRFMRRKGYKSLTELRGLAQ